MSSTRSTVAAAVRAEMARAGVKRRHVAEATGLSYETLGRRLRGEAAFDVDELAAIAKLLDIPLTRLVEVAA